MPPKPKFNRDEIIQAALALVSERGIDALTTRELGDKLGSSARPIFTVFQNMEELRKEVRAAAMARFEAYTAQTVECVPLFKQVGMRMVCFGQEEPKLYQLLFMEEHEGVVGFNEMFGMLGTVAEQCIAAIRQDYGLEEGEAKTLFEHVWVYTFGMGALCATGMCRFSTEQLGQMLSTQFQAMLRLIRSGDTDDISCAIRR